VSRYQIAAALTKLMDRVEKSGGGGLSERELDNLEALTVEFADEIALLTTKVTRIEEDLTRVQADMDDLKDPARGLGSRGGSNGGISGLASLRAVRTGSNGPRGAIGSTLGPNGGTSGSYHPLTRYGGDVLIPTGVVTDPHLFADRTFLTIPQFSVAFDRDYVEGLGIHAQIDIDVDAADNLNGIAGALPVDLPGGSGAIQINETYIDAFDLFDHVAARVGAFALPMTREHNGSHRSLDYTITPSAVSSRLESYRPIGLELRKEKPDSEFEFRGAIFSGLDGPSPGVVVPVDNAISGLLFPTLAARTMLSFPGTAANSPYSDAPAGVRSSGVTGTIGSGLGFYGRIAHRGTTGFDWDLNYLSNGGNVVGSNDRRPSGAEFSWGVLTLSRAWQYLDAIVQVYSGRTPSTATNGALRNPRGQTATSLGAYALFSYRFDPESNFTLRLETNSDKLDSQGELAVQAITLAYNRVLSDRSMIQLEWIAPKAVYRSRGVPAPPSMGTVPGSTFDQDDSMIQLNFKFRW